MNLLIIGATGGTGRQLVAQALEQGHTVTALVRNPARLQLHHARLQVVAGDVLDPASIAPAMSGQEAVLCALGAPASQKDQVRSTGTRHLLRAMQQAGVRRLVCLTTFGIGDTAPALPPLYKYLLVPLLLRHAFADSALQEQYIYQSTLDWVIARPGTLTNGPRTGTYQHGFAPTASGLKIRIARADVADFMLRQLHDTRYLKQAVSLSY